LVSYIYNQRVWLFPHKPKMFLGSSQTEGVGFWMGAKAFQFPSALGLGPEECLKGIVQG
jgi:hypothetical protein